MIVCNSQACSPVPLENIGYGGDDGPAIRAAIECAEECGEVLIPRDARIDGDLVIDKPVSLVGVGLPHLEIFDGGIVIDGSLGNTLPRVVMRDMKITRRGSIGEALHIKNNGSAQPGAQGAPVYFDLENIRILGSTSGNGEGLVIEGGFLGTLRSVWVRYCDVGVVMRRGSGTDSGVSANAVSWHGGEIQNNRIGLQASDTRGVNFNGVTVEGNDEIGIELVSGNKGFSFLQGYFESNGTGDTDFTDVVIGSDPTKTVNRGTSFAHNIYIPGGSKRHAITANYGIGTHINSEDFGGYLVSAIRNPGFLLAGARQMTGGAWCCSINSAGLPIIDNQTGTGDFNTGANGFRYGL